MSPRWQALQSGLSLARLERHWRSLARDSYVAVCELVRDLQLFGYTLEEIKAVADLVRDYIGFRDDLESYPKPLAAERFGLMFAAIDGLNARMEQLKGGIARWEELLKRYRKEFQNLSSRNDRRSDGLEGDGS